MHQSFHQAVRRADVSRALRLEFLTIAWMVVEAVVAISVGLAARSLVLQAFGFDSVIELLSAGLLIWRLDVELKHGAAFPEAIERRASRVGGALLFLLTAYVMAGGILTLWLHRGQDAPLAGVLLTAAAIPIMSWLARRKFALAETLNSPSLRADAVESLTCGYLSTAVCVSLVAQWLIGAWWVSGVSAIVVAPFLFREAREAWRADRCCYDS
jgi:divalent metal cation (Fe/Co/Zn/Cd) transporter